MKSVTVIAHPLVQHNLTRLRDKRTESEEFRRGLGEVAALMVYEATRSFQTRSIDHRLDGKGFIVPGLGDAGDRLFGF